MMDVISKLINNISGNNVNTNNMVESYSYKFISVLPLVGFYIFILIRNAKKK